MKDLRPDDSVRLVGALHPAARDVLRGYGESAQRAVFGHLEPLARFARRCGVPPERLMHELSVATGLPWHERPRHGDRAHRPFLVAALAITLTVGAGWGAWLLLRIGLGGDFAAVPARAVVAHGDAQLWGFLTLFILGIAMRYLPDLANAPPVGDRARLSLLPLISGGSVLGFLWGTGATPSRLAGGASGLLLVAGTAVHASVVIRLVLARRREPWAAFVLCSALWLVAWAAWTTSLRLGAGLAGPAAFSIADRRLALELALWGVALNATYGFGAKLIPGFLGTGGTLRTGLVIALAAHQAALLAACAAHAASAPGLSLASSALLLAGLVAYGAALRGFRRRPHARTPEKGHPFLQRYVQTAFGWLAFALAATLWLDGMTLALGAPPPHALWGAVRHAATVGFATLLIMGIGQRLLPILEHGHLAFPGLVHPIYALLVGGCALRVTSELAAPWSMSAMRWMPMSSVLELAAIALFAANVIRTMWPPPDPLVRTGRVTPASRLAVLLAEHPWMEDELIGWGLDYVRRVRQVPAQLSLGSMARAAGLDPEQLAAWVNESLATNPIARAVPDGRGGYADRFERARS